MPTTRNFLTFVLLVCLGAPTYSLEYQFRDQNDGTQRRYLSVSGEVVSGDCERITKAIADEVDDGRLVETVVLKSPGGSLIEGLCIGRLFRDIRIVTLAPSLSDVPESDICASACALMWLGGMRRLGVAYVHHPYMNAEVDLRFGGFQEALESARLEIYSFVSEMNVEARIADYFLSAPSSEIAPLSAEENNLEYDPVLLEFLISNCGPALTSNEKEILRALEANEREGLNQGDPVYSYAFKSLSEKDDAWGLCRAATVKEIQKDAQFK